MMHDPFRRQDVINAVVADQAREPVVIVNAELLSFLLQVIQELEKKLRPALVAAYRVVKDVPDLAPAEQFLFVIEVTPPVVVEPAAVQAAGCIAVPIPAPSGFLQPSHKLAPVLDPAVADQVQFCLFSHILSFL